MTNDYADYTYTHIRGQNKGGLILISTALAPLSLLVLMGTQRYYWGLCDAILLMCDILVIQY